MTAEPSRLILASASPRRLDLLRQVGVEPAAVVPADLDETPRAGELPHFYVRRMATEKLEAVCGEYGEAWVLAADTVVALGRRVLPKAEDPDVARRCLQMLSGRRHRVLGAVALATPDGRRLMRTVVTRVAFRRLDEASLQGYLDSGEWQGKAGGYAIQGAAAAFVPWINGSYPNVVGLPLAETMAMLLGSGFVVGKQHKTLRKEIRDEG